MWLLSKIDTDILSCEWNGLGNGVEVGQGNELTKAPGYKQVTGVIIESR